nr:NAD(P)-binding protein [Niveibacterium umoris]
MAGAAGLPSTAAEASLAYPPAATGLQGQTDAARAPLHALRDGQHGAPGTPREHYDLVVVGAGISGLAAAFLYRQQAGRRVRMLIVDPLDDFGGHAKRNEFTTPDGRLLIGYGGSQSLDSPSQWSPAAHQLLKDVGVDLAQFEHWYDKDWAARRGLTGHAILFNAAHWGREQLLVRHEGSKAADWVDATPLPAKAREDLRELIDAPRDYLAGLSREEKRARLARTSYDDFLAAICGYDRALTRYFANRTRGYFGVGTDATTALDAWAGGLPGFGGMDLGDEMPPELSPSGRQAFKGSDPYIYHFPDGNAGVARALVRALVPSALPGHGMESLVGARCDYARLDRVGADVRLRLRTSAVSVRHIGDPAAAKAVAVTCRSREGDEYTVSAGQVVLACWSRVIPHLTDELPAAQVSALRDQVKVPLLYANVLLRNWEAFARGGFSAISNPGGFWDEASLDFPVSTDRYRFASLPSDPVLVHLARVMVEGGGASERAQCEAGRARLERLGFNEIEHEIRALLQGALGPFGFEHERDIHGITVNRWAHGYAYEYMRPWDAYWPDGPLPIHTARMGWGRIAIANSDAGAFAYVHSAIDQATRAVSELLPQARLARWNTSPGPS